MTVNEYLELAQKLISSYGASQLIKDDDAVSYVATALMKADDEFDGRGNVYGYRSACARFAIGRWIIKQKRDRKTRAISIESKNSNSRDTIGQCIEDDRYPHEEEIGEILDCIRGLELDEKYKTYFMEYFVDGLSYRDIGKKYDISHEWVRVCVNKVLTQIKERLDVE